MHPPGPHPEHRDHPRPLWSSRGAGRSPHLPICVHSWLPEVLQAQALTVVHHHHHLNLLAQLGWGEGEDQAGFTGRSRDGVAPTGWPPKFSMGRRDFMGAERGTWAEGQQEHGLVGWQDAELWDGRMNQRWTYRVGRDMVHGGVDRTWICGVEGDELDLDL